MISYETDEEKVEALKKWWKENGLSIIVGVVVGLGAIFGWRTWVGYRDAVAQRASAAFEQLLNTAAAGDIQSALAQSELLIEEFPSTAYATLAALARARMELESDNPSGARAALEQAIADSPDPGITRIAALRLGRILVAAGDLQAAADLVAKHEDAGSFSGAFAALRGAIAEAQGRVDDARAAYQQAVAAGAPNEQELRLKLDELAPAG